LAVRAKYEGPGSWYSRFEGVFAPGYGVTPFAGASIAALILRDLRRGWGYDDYGRRIPVNEGVAKSRLLYLIPLCEKHMRHSPQCDEVRKVVYYAVEHKALPPGTEVWLAGPNAAKVAEEIRRYGIASNVHVMTVATPQVIEVPIVRRRK